MDIVVKKWPICVFVSEYFRGQVNLNTVRIYAENSTKPFSDEQELITSGLTNQSPMAPKCGAKVKQQK